MTTLPPPEYTLHFVREPGTLTVRVRGDLDYDTSDDVLDAVLEQLAVGQAPRDVRLDFGDLTWIDSTGLSTLLMIHRRTSTLGATLHLDNRPAVLERMLLMTNVLDHLIAPADERAGAELEEDGVSGAGAT